MTLSYNIGLTIGSLIGYIFDHMLGEQLTDTSIICPVYPYAPQKPTITSVISTTSSTILSTFISKNGNNLTTISSIVDTMTSTIVTGIKFTTTASSYPFHSTTVNDDSYNTLTELELLSTSNP